MTLPSIQLSNMDIKLELEHMLLNVLYVKFGYFVCSIPPHSHSRGSYELHYIPIGYGKLIAGGHSYSITPGTLFITGPDVVHEQIPDEYDPMAEYCIFFEVQCEETHPAPIKKIVRKETMLTDWLLATPFWIGVDKENMMEMFEMLANELNGQRAGYYHSAKNILEMIIIRFIRQYSVENAEPQSAPQKTLGDNRLLIIENSFLYQFQTITLKQLADRLGLSVRQTERTVRKQYGQSFQQKKMQARMDAASRLLVSTDLAIHMIADQVGFPSAERFSNAFKRYFGITASRYRNVAKEGNSQI